MRPSPRRLDQAAVWRRDSAQEHLGLDVELASRWRSVGEQRPSARDEPPASRPGNTTRIGVVEELDVDQASP